MLNLRTRVPFRAAGRRCGHRFRRRGGGPVDFIEASVIDARLRDVQAELRRLNAEEREGR